LVSADVLVPEEGSVAWHLRSDLELSTVMDWLRWVLNTLLVKVPGLVETIVAVPEDHMSVVRVMTSMDVQAFSTVVSNISDGA
jgi:hypothetical protein